MKVAELKEKLKKIKYEEDGTGRVAVQPNIIIDRGHTCIREFKVPITTVTYDYQNTVWLSNWGYNPCSKQFESLGQLISILDDYQDDFKVAIAIYSHNGRGMTKCLPIIDYDVYHLERKWDDHYTYKYIPADPAYVIHFSAKMPNDKYHEFDDGWRYSTFEQIALPMYEYNYIIRGESLKIIPGLGKPYMYLNENMTAFAEYPLKGTIFPSAREAEKWFNDNFERFKEKGLDKQLDINTLEIVAFDLRDWTEKKLEVSKIEEETK